MTEATAADLTALLCSQGVDVTVEQVQKTLDDEEGDIANAYLEIWHNKASYTAKMLKRRPLNEKLKSKLKAGVRIVNDVEDIEQINFK